MTYTALRLAFLLPAFVFLLVGSCAKSGSPPGGPEDKTPPYVVDVNPAGGSVRVSPTSRISIEFSEKMKKRTVETAVLVSPPCRWRKRYWQDGTYHLVPEQELRAGTTYLISVSNKVTDAHGVKMEATFVSGFSTGDSIDAGIISGRIRWKRLTVQEAVVTLLEATDPSVAAAYPLEEPVYVTLSGSQGLYEIPFVDTGRDYWVFSFIDDNANSEYDEGEIVGCFPGPVSFGEAVELEDIDVTLCGETLFGSLEGRVDTSAVPDTVKVSIVVRSVSDTSTIYHAFAGADGGFKLDCVRPGAYLIEAFSDFDEDHKKDPEDTFSVELGDTVSIRSCTEAAEVGIIFSHEN